MSLAYYMARRRLINLPGTGTGGGNALLLSGDQTDGDDRLLLTSIDELDPAEVLLLSGDQT